MRSLFRPVHQFSQTAAGSTSRMTLQCPIALSCCHACSCLRTVLPRPVRTTPPLSSNAAGETYTSCLGGRYARRAALPSVSASVGVRKAIGWCDFVQKIRRLVKSGVGWEDDDDDERGGDRGGSSSRNTRQVGKTARIVRSMAEGPCFGRERSPAKFWIVVGLNVSFQLSCVQCMLEGLDLGGLRCMFGLLSRSLHWVSAVCSSQKETQK